MIPYIAILILLIAVILWQVYSMSESFETAITSTPYIPLKVTEDTTMRQLLDNISKIVAALMDLKGKYAGKVFKPKILPQEAVVLGYTSKTDASGNVVIEGDTSIEMLRKKIQDELTTFEGQLAAAQKSIQSGETRIDAKMIDKVFTDSTMSPEQAKMIAKNMIDFLNTNNEYIAKKITAFTDILNRETLISAPTTPFASTKPTTTTDASGSTVEVKTTSADATPVEKKVELTKPKETPVCSEPEKVEKITPEFQKELEDRLAKNISTQLKDEMAATHQMQCVIDDMTPYAPCNAEISSDGMAQGYEYKNLMPKLFKKETNAIKKMDVPANPDMSKYVRKDSIPCWGCTIDY